PRRRRRGRGGAGARQQPPHGDGGGHHRLRAAVAHGLRRGGVRVTPADLGGAPAPRAAGTLRVACVQLATRQDVAANVRAARELVEAAADQGARLVALPETWAYKGLREGILATAEAVDGPSNRELAAVAARCGVWLLAGSVYEPAPGGLVS